MKEHSYADLLRMNEYDIVTEFSIRFFNMQYDEAMQIIGIMKARGMDDVRRLEVMLYFEQGNFGKVRQILKKELLLDTEEKEFYYTSLLELGLEEEFSLRVAEIEAHERKENIARPITYDCYLYLVWLLTRQNKEDSILEKIPYDVEMHSFFSRKYPWCIVETLADIYLLNEERLQLKAAGVDAEELESIDSGLNRQFEGLRKIYYEADTFYSFIKEETSVSISAIAFVAKYNCIVLNGPRGSGIYDIVHLMELYRRISSKDLKKVLVAYQKKLIEAIRNDNDYVIDFIKHTYLAALNEPIIDDEYLTALKTLVGEVPYLNKEWEEHKDEKTIMSILSPKGQFAYKAAVLQYTYSLEHEYGGVDAGMLCLSYMRILELEVSQRIIIPLAKCFDSIKDTYSECLSMCRNEDDRIKFSDHWAYIITELEKVKNQELDGFMMGAICALFERMKVKRYRNNIHERMRESIDMYLSQILSDEGNKNREAIQRIFASKNRERFRNPPAHTRYVGINTALECKSFVERNLIYLNDWIREKVD